MAETDLALYVSGDLRLWRRALVASACPAVRACRQRGGSLPRGSASSSRDVAAEMPEGVDWDRLAAEMTANIRVGLAAGECVAPRGSANRAVLELASGGGRWRGLAAVLVGGVVVEHAVRDNAGAGPRDAARSVHGHGSVDPAGMIAMDDAGWWWKLRPIGNRVAGERRHAGRFAGCGAAGDGFGERARLGQRALRRRGYRPVTITSVYAQ